MKSRHIFHKNINLSLQDSAQKSVIINYNKLTGYLKRAVKVLESFISAKEIGINNKKIEIFTTLCGAARIRSLNWNYRKKDQVTDVLSFPVHETIMKEENPEIFSGPILSLGDIFICKEVALKQSKDNATDLEEEIIELFLHGFLHLCGLDHERSKKEERKMLKLQEELLIEILDK